jgi:hypothetical protein
LIDTVGTKGVKVPNRKWYINALTLLLLFITSTSNAQNVIWSGNHGGHYNENAGSGVETTDGGFAILGSTFSINDSGYDMYLIKINTGGDTVWSHKYGGMETEYGYDITSVIDGFVLVGSTRSFGEGKRDVYLVKTDFEGNMLWSKTFGGPEDEEARSVQATSDGGLILCGTTNSSGAGYSDIYLIKTNSTGDTLWTRTYGGSGGESGYCVRQVAADNGFIAIGATGSFGEGYSSVYAVRVDAQGDSIWAGAYGGTAADFGYSIEISPDGGFIFAGATASFGAGYSDAYLIKTDAMGFVEWSQTYGGSGEDRGFSICRSLDGNYMIVGSTSSFGAGKNDIYMVKINPVGEIIWSETYGGVEADYGRAVFQESGHNHILIGESSSHSKGGLDLYILKIGAQSTAIEDDQFPGLPSDFMVEQNYPNPFNSSTIIEYNLPEHATVRIIIYNVLGQVVKEFDPVVCRVGRNNVRWDARDDFGRDVATGIYFYQIMAGEYNQTKKMVYLK